MTPPAFTREQRAAIAAREGPSLLAANAGSGKTAVMVERFAAAVREDGVAVGSILAVTFTEKAAGELRERLRRRLLELGQDEHARAVDAAWIGTIHGFCARLLRAQPLAAGLDPRFEVLDEPAASRAGATAYERVLEDWARAAGAPAIDLAAAYGPGLRELVLGAYESLRARGHARPRLAIASAGEAPAATLAASPGGAPDPAALAAAREAALRSLAGAGEGVRVAAGRAALAACAELLDAAQGVPWPGELDAAELKGGARALAGPECGAYREAWAAYRMACAGHHAQAHLRLLDALLDRFGGAYDAIKAARAAVDFADLELRARDLLADPATRRRWAERFALIMVDEFQDTNAVQLEILEALERDNLFAVGDEFQSIYRFRHADVAIFRARAAALGAERVRGLEVNFRSREELLDVLNAAFSPELGPRFAPLRAGRREPLADADGALRLFDLGPPAGAPPVELLVTDTHGWDELEPRLGLAGGGDQPWRRAEARLVAHRLRDEVVAGRRPGELVVLVRATASLRLLEQALEEQGLPTYVVGGRGYWSQEQVRDGLAWLRVLANPRDEAALLTVLASPFCGAGTDALVLLTAAGREPGKSGEPRRLWAALQSAAAGAAGVTAVGLAVLPAGEAERIVAVARILAAERERAERAPLEALLEHAIVATGYDLAVLARPGGERRLANLRKLMRLARDFERAEGRDLRGFLADAAARDLAEAREGEAALESDGLDAVRLMTIHRAKGLEFPVVCVADLGRAAGNGRSRLLVGRDGTTGLRLAPLGGGDTVPTADWERLAAEEAREEAEEERRLFYVAMTRARDLLILSGGTDTRKWPAPRPGGPPIEWIARAVAGDVAALPAAGDVAGGAAGEVAGGAAGEIAGGTAGRDEAASGVAGAAGRIVLDRVWDGRAARVRCLLNAPETLGAVLPGAALTPRPRARAAAATALPAVPAVVPPRAPRPRPVPQRLSYSSLAAYARCGYRFYLERTLRLPRVAPPPEAAEAVAEPEPAIGALMRGSLVHRALEDLDFARPVPPDDEAVMKIAADAEVELTAADIEDVRALVAAFAGSPLCARLAAAPRVRREAGFAFALDPGGAGPLVNGFVDVLAREADGGALVVDYKTDRLGEGEEPADLIERDYETQRLVYALAALREGAPHVEVAHCLLDRPAEPVSRTFTAADAPELAGRLSELARGVLAHEYPVTATPHRELCGDCPGRRALCSWPETRTLAPQASAGSFAGSTGPS